MPEMGERHGHPPPGEGDHSLGWWVHFCPAPRQQPEGVEEAPRGRGRHSTRLFGAHPQTLHPARARALQMRTEQPWTPSAPSSRVPHVTPSPKRSKAPWTPLLGGPQSTPPRAGLTHPASQYSPALCRFSQCRPPLLPTMHHTPPHPPTFCFGCFPCQPGLPAAPRETCNTGRGWLHVMLHPNPGSEEVLISLLAG